MENDRPGAVETAPDAAPPALRPYILGPGQGVGGDPSVKASRVSTGGGITLIESRTRGGAPMHVHSRDDECFYVVEGTITVGYEGETYEAGPRSFVFLPRGIPHDCDVVGPDPATVLMITVPAGLEEFLAQFHAAGSSEDRDQVAERHGIRFIR